MDSSSCIGQTGVIEEISDGKVSVCITKTITCAGCHALDACTMFDNSTRKIILSVSDEQFQTGDKVNVIMKRSLGWKATALAYFLPFIILFSILILLSSFKVSELANGVIILLALTCYFLCLYFLRDRLQRTFRFFLQKSS
jgi:positive regulator of sigma E activity